MDVNQIRQGLKVCVVEDNGTEGMLIKPQHLDIRQVGKVGTILNYVPGHGGDVWFVKQDNGIAAYCFNELEPANHELGVGAQMDIISFRIGHYMCGLFPYWVGFSRRSLGSMQVVDIGFFKAMWPTPNKASTRQGRA